MLKLTFTAAHLTLAEPPPFTSRAMSQYMPRVVIELSGRGDGITVPTQLDIEHVTRCLQHRHPHNWVHNTPIYNWTGTRPETRTALNSVYVEDMMWRAEYTGEWSGADDSEEDESNVSTFCINGCVRAGPGDRSVRDRPSPRRRTHERGLRPYLWAGGSSRSTSVTVIVWVVHTPDWSVST